MNGRNKLGNAVIQILDNFKLWFLGKVEPSFGGSNLKAHNLKKNITNISLMLAIGDSHKETETTLTEMFSLMKKQCNGKRGTLLTNGKANIFYINNANYWICSVCCRWDDGGWSCDAYSMTVDKDDEWLAGSRVFSRSPLSA